MRHPRNHHFSNLHRLFQRPVRSFFGGGQFEYSARSVSARLSSQDASIGLSIDMTSLGLRADAKARPVRNGGNWLLEYVFVVTVDEVDHEVFRFYFNDDADFEDIDGELFSTTESPMNISNTLCEMVYSGALQSDLFAPLPKP